MKNFITLIDYILDILKKDQNIINAIYYLWKRNNWMLDIRYLTSYFTKIPIDSPIFLLGNQGDGLTLISRIIRRNPKIISVSGNSNYWAGADEMVSVYEPILGAEFSGLLIDPAYHQDFPPPYGWSHASNDLIKFYRKTERDFNGLSRKKLLNAIGMAILHHGKKIKNPRFIDKSQLFSVKLSFINKLLENYNPYFIHITRNPFATIYRAAASGQVEDMKRASKYLTLEQRFQICSEHWVNVAKCIEVDKKKVKNFLRIKVEDFLENPKKITEKLCKFLNLKFDMDMLPQPYHSLPLGVRSDKKKWYPLEKEINRKYLEKTPLKFIKKIQNKAKLYLDKFGYKAP